MAMSMPTPMPRAAEAHAARGDARMTAGEIKDLKARDNVTNIYYIGRIYVIVAATVAATLWSYSAVANMGLGWWWNIPATFVAWLAIGASQHQLGGVVHEGTHYMLFADRKVSEIASDWLGAFPIFTSTYNFRLHHLAHHQFINDPERDPNFGLAEDSGHWLDFPIAHVELLLAIARRLWPPNLVRYIVARARYSALGVDSNPYADPKRPGSKWSIRAGVLFAVGAPILILPFILRDQWALAWTSLLLAWAAITAYYWFLPIEDYPQSRIEPVISHRATVLCRTAYAGLLYCALTATAQLTGAPVWGYFLLFWILPLFATFPMFMILREWLQHGNGDRGRYTNSRVFFVNPFIRYAVFPFGQDYHLPHHLIATVPHYKLKVLHDMLRRDPEYAQKGLEVEGWSRRNAASGRPTIVDVLGPEHTPAARAAAHVDTAALEDAEINDMAAINRHVELSRQTV